MATPRTAWWSAPSTIKPRTASKPNRNGTASSAYDLAVTTITAAVAAVVVVVAVGSAAGGGGGGVGVGGAVAVAVADSNSKARDVVKLAQSEHSLVPAAPSFVSQALGSGVDVPTHG